jgi:hypothetical protein
VTRLLVVAGFERPDVGQRAPVFRREGRGGFRLFDVFPRSVERRTFMPKKALRLDANTRCVPRVSIKLE